jgi:hypothetical protein
MLTRKAFHLLNSHIVPFPDRAAGTVPVSSTNKTELADTTDKSKKSILKCLLGYKAV